MIETLDGVDRAILRILQAEGRISFVALAGRVNLSKSPCIARVRRLEKMGLIARYAAQLDARKLGFDYVVFVQVKLSSTTEDTLSAFNAAVGGVAEIQACHMIAGGFDYLLKVRTKDMASYRRLLGETIAQLPGVTQTSTFPVMESVKDVADLPI